MRRRVLLVLMIYSTVVVLALSVPLALLVGRERAQRFGENRAAAASFFAELSSREDESGVDRIRESLQRYNSLYDEGVAVVDRTGGARATSGLELQRADVQQAVAGALRNQRGDLPSSLTPWSASSVLIAAPVGGGTQVDGAVVLEASTDSARRDVAIAWVVIAVGALLILATVAVIAVALSRWVVRPLSALSSRVHSFGDKFHDQVSVEGSQRLEPVPYVGPPEVRELSSAFEAMADDVEAATAAQRRLVADTAHALRNPLAALRIRMDILGMRVPDSATDAHSRTTLEVDRLSSVVEGLLVLAAAETPARTRSSGCDLGAVVADRVEFWSSTIVVAGMTVHVSEPDADADCRVAMSEDDLTRILDALLSNATKYAGSGSGIEIDYRSSDVDVTMWLSDNGPGVPADELGKVVDRFYRASGTHGDGTGLGLSIVHALTERAGGSLRVLKRRPVGLQIELRLPRVVS
ncbi:MULTISPECIES: HAMP domain-containing sensor histidine kinase [unclassified Rhodococcus (in: high G+C Gram-positive bacteria)]|uniref:sensor histidine kinase n=1 Tax=unclassified Rhodococcus (in: high G+C Gram-positive bacteria) TaxID=192944 RepID=UPI00211B058E|nr:MULTISPECIES: HAMP domain-containing sensor histidine kinase [unclassified Rhodococcus (in: high G+C Gram-positive bacteria)]